MGTSKHPLVQDNETGHWLNFLTRDACSNCRGGAKLYFKLRMNLAVYADCERLERVRECLRRAQWPPPPPQNKIPPVSRLSRYSGLQVRNHRVLLRKTQTIFTLHRTTLPSSLSQTNPSILNPPFPRPPAALPLRPRGTRQIPMGPCQSVVHLPRPAACCNARLSMNNSNSHRLHPLPRLVR